MVPEEWLFFFYVVKLYCRNLAFSLTPTITFFSLCKVVLVLHEEVEASEGCEGDAGADDDYR